MRSNGPDHTALVSPGFHSKCEGRPLESVKQGSDIIQLMLQEQEKGGN